MALTWAQFTAIPNNTRILNHGYDQCVALVNYYTTDVLGAPLPSGIGSAHQWWNTRNTQPNLINNFNFSSSPAAGGIFVGRNGIYDSPNGHVGVITSLNSNGTFNTMEQNAGKYRYTGRYTRGFANILGFLIPKKSPIPTPSGGAEVRAHYHVEDALSKTGSRNLTPNAGFYMHTDPKKGTSNAVNIAGGAGYYSFTEHVYAEGAPGDILNVYLLWQTDPDKPTQQNSDHYRHQIVIGPNGTVQDNFEFKRYVGATGRTVAVYAHISAASTNKKSVKVTRFDSDAYLFN